MKNELAPQESAPAKKFNRSSRWSWLLMAGCALLVLIGISRRSRPADGVSNTIATNAVGMDEARNGRGIERPRSFTRGPNPSPIPTPDEIVAGKLSQFARSRREFVRALARRHGVEVSGDVERFFDAVESGHWDAIDAAFKKINGGDSTASHSGQRPPGIEYLWPAIIDAYGVAEQVHEWPAQKLLDYGNAVLSSLRPGMVYVGGTDNGRWIPELLNDTSDGERHTIVTQNALADLAYLDYIRLQYDDRLATLTDEDFKNAFQKYVADATARLKHDEEHPEEPKQIRPGEDVRMVDAKVQVGGQVAVMAINEKLFQSLMAKNPDLSFALQESFPLKSTYADALPLGPLMELGAANGQNSFTAERAAQSLDYWRNTVQQLLSDPEAAGSPTALKSYSHDTVAAANLLAEHNFSAEAEQAYRLAAQLWPENPESVGGLADLLVRTGRENEARQLLDEFTRQHPSQRKDLERISTAFRVIGSTPPAKP